MQEAKKYSSLLVLVFILIKNTILIVNPYTNLNTNTNMQ